MLTGCDDGLSAPLFLALGHATFPIHGESFHLIWCAVALLMQPRGIAGTYNTPRSRAVAGLFCFFAVGIGVGALGEIFVVYLQNQFVFCLESPQKPLTL